MNKNKTLEGRYWHFIDNIMPDPAHKLCAGQKPEVLLWVSLPLNHRGQFLRKIQSFHPEPTEIIEDKINGNQVAFWNEPQTRPDTERVGRAQNLNR